MFIIIFIKTHSYNRNYFTEQKKKIEGNSQPRVVLKLVKQPHEHKAHTLVAGRIMSDCLRKRVEQ